MSTITNHKSDPVAEALAQRVVEDIAERGLVTGDRYLTGDEACDTFQVGKALLNNTFKLLADRQYLVRKRKAGTYVGPHFQAEGARDMQSTAGLDVVHVLMPMDFFRAKLVSGSVFVEQLSAAIPRVSVQVHYIDDDKLRAYTQDLVELLTQDTSSKQGLILLRSPRESDTSASEQGTDQNPSLRKTGTTARF